MTISAARKALRQAIAAHKLTIEIGRNIRHNNGDTVMIGAAADARRNLLRIIERLCNIVPNASIMNREILNETFNTNIPVSMLANPTRHVSVAPKQPVCGNVAQCWCDECSNPADACLCVK